MSQLESQLQRLWHHKKSRYVLGFFNDALSTTYTKSNENIIEINDEFEKMLKS
jgi:hypothetical protein